VGERAAAIKGSLFSLLFVVLALFFKTLHRPSHKPLQEVW
jgi:hypothetical protein